MALRQIRFGHSILSWEKLDPGRASGLNEDIANTGTGFFARQARYSSPSSCGQRLGGLLLLINLNLAVTDCFQEN